MMPPICAVCDFDFRDKGPEYQGGLVRFAHDDEDEWDEDQFDETDEENENPEQPDYVQWLCADHFEEAEKLTYLPSKQAINRLKAMFKI